jgi:N-methylhydantoinase B/oxoprolinase/acetone carboxylase alpha subunit
MHIDAVDLEVVKASLSGIVQEMQNSLFRTGFSTIVRESQDASCAIMDAGGAVIAQHVVLPLHMGAFPACCEAVLRAYGNDIVAGDAYLINHPYEGGSPHAPDMAVITPVFFDGALIGFCGSIAHKSDIGGPVPGSCSGQAREIFNEGLHLPAVRYVRGGQRSLDIERIIAANSRTPELVLGDIRGQLGASRLGEERVRALVKKFGKADARFSIRSSKHIIAPLGAAGGGPGRTGDIVINPGTAEEKHLPTRYADYPLKAGEVFRLDTPGGGGLGDPHRREPAKVLADVVEGYVSAERAAKDYGVAVVRTGRGWIIDEIETQKLRTSSLAPQGREGRGEGETKRKQP